MDDNIPRKGTGRYRPDGINARYQCAFPLAIIRPRRASLLAELDVKYLPRPSSRTRSRTASRGRFWPGGYAVIGPF